MPKLLRLQIPCTLQMRACINDTCILVQSDGDQTTLYLSDLFCIKESRGGLCTLSFMIFSEELGVAGRMPEGTASMKNQCFRLPAGLYNSLDACKARSKLEPLGLCRTLCLCVNSMSKLALSCPTPSFSCGFEVWTPALFCTCGVCTHGAGREDCPHNLPRGEILAVGLGSKDPCIRCQDLCTAERRSRIAFMQDDVLKTAST